jgi:hypothetical protein
MCASRLKTPTERMTAFVEEVMRMSITYRQNNCVKLLPKIQFSINSTPSKASRPVALKPQAHFMLRKEGMLLRIWT